ncbi:CshA/CshB family fibrillar adhesin-related protein [Chitinophaga agri]|uniref:Gliding motility-associated C-terminal domain-containing protein n=1 Tax=Chitinophaga agri TaxID=2703787 RepID=A0A6B9ZC02_9BACT|nr:CshA/CshB family fibrillar adhesin-related protein [Chitinophaga agri]QHS59646.1 gliding motility-associated C-terminal domain-containing protein [Chitinophaga agri]
MPRFLLLPSLLLLLHTQSFAQFADAGTGHLRDAVWWMDWSGMKIENGATRTFITADGLSVTFTLSDVAGTPVSPKKMNTWNGALLKSLYDFTDTTIQPALWTPNNFFNSSFTITVSATRHGRPAPCTLVAADAEASSTLESLVLTTSAGTWRTIEFFRTSTQVNNPLVGCGTATATISDTYGGTPGIGQLPVIAADIPAVTSFRLDVGLLRTGHGSSAVALGIISQTDEGDLPASYGYAAHQLVYATQQPCNYAVPFPLTNLQSALYLGSVPGDADPAGMTEDNLHGPDEEALSAFPDYTGNGEYTLTLPLHNSTGRNAYISGWFDYNRNGVFERTEMVTAVVPANATNATLSWTGLPDGFIKGRMPQYGFRFRIATDQRSVSTPAGFAPDGEVEDYLVTIQAPCAANINTLSNMVLCAGKPAQLNASGGVKYQWTPSTGLSADTIPNPLATPMVTTTYTVNGVDAEGCPGAASLTIHVNPSPVFNKRSDTAICAGKSVQLYAISDIPATYSWSPDSSLSNGIISDPVATPVVTTSYTATATTIYGCTSKAVINVVVNPAPEMRVIPDTPVACLGQTIDVVCKGGDVYRWYTDRDSLLANGPMITIAPTCDSLFKVYMEHHTCAVSDTFMVPVKVHPLPVAGVVKSGDIDCAHPEVILEATGGRYYSWTPAVAISNSLVANPVVSPLKTATYEVTVMDENGCTEVKAITVNVDVALSFTRYPVPSAFSPNGDGRNDCFGLKFWGETNTFEFNVFNRHGNMVFSTRYPGDCWDGTFKGMAQPAGTYVYMIRAKTVCGDVLRKGTVILAR